MEPRNQLPAPSAEELERERRRQAAQSGAVAPEASRATTRMQSQAAPTTPSAMGRQYLGPPEEAPSDTSQTRVGPTGFVGFGQQQAANVEAAERMAGQLGQAALESGGADLLRSKEGRQALLEKALGKAGGVTPLDAALAGAAGADYFAQLDAQYGPEAQARRAAERRAAQEKARTTQEQQNQRAAQSTQEAASLQMQEARRLRLMDSQKGPGRMTTEQWARVHGMTLEQWIARGKQPPFPQGY